MSVLQSEWRGRLSHWIRVLMKDLYTPLGRIDFSVFRTFDQLSCEEALKQEYTPVRPGFTWGYPYEYCWMKASFCLPEEAEGRWIILDLWPQGESTLFVNGKAFGTYRGDWVEPRHIYIEDNILSTCAKAGEKYDLLMEVYAGHDYPDEGGRATGPVIPGSMKEPEPDGARRLLKECTYGVWNEDAYQLFMDVMTLSRLLDVTPEKELRASRLAKALQQFTLIADFEQDAEARTESYRKAREVLKPALEAQNGSTSPLYYAIGNAHLDLAWLWPMKETYRKTARTFAAQLRLMELYPEYRFLQSQPASYEMCRKYYPELFARIVKAAREGRWVADGAMWVEPDTNMIGGEAMIRQLLYGKKYFREYFDVESEVLWLPDSFGYSGALPQILKGCGVKYMVTQKIFWSYNESENFPYHYFNWRGIDGSEVISFLPTSYSYYTDPKELNNIWQNRRQTEDLDAFLVPFGYGDGGGGPSRDFIEYIRRQKNLEGSPRVKMADPACFFKEMEENQGKPVNTWTGELYFPAHRGTYTSQAAIKRNNRKAELTLRELEIWGSLAFLMGRGVVPAGAQARDTGYSFPAARTEELWKEVLLHQFHDILPGSGIACVCEEARQRVGAVIGEGTQLAEEARSCLGTSEKGAVTLFNSLGFSRRETVTLPESFAGGALMKDGSVVPVTKGTDGWKALVEIPPLGAVSLRPAAGDDRKDRGSDTLPSQAVVCARVDEDGSIRLANSVASVVINSRGEVTSYRMKDGFACEFAAAPMNVFHVYRDIPRLYDAWDIDSTYLLQEAGGAAQLSARLLSQPEDGSECFCGAEAVVQVTGRILNSTVTQLIRMQGGSPVLTFETEVDWHELHKLLKVSFPVNVYAEEGINEVQFGYVKRPTHRSRQYDRDRFEVCNHRYSALADGSHGAAVLNDCKYGISMNDNDLALTLLRATASPEMQADNGLHRFTYGFTAWEKPFAESDVVRQAAALNAPAAVVRDIAADFSAFSVDRDNVMIESVKLAEDGSNDLILRLYEAVKSPCECRLQVAEGLTKAWACDMLENKQEELELTEQEIRLSFRGFEIRTIRLSA